MRKILPPTLLIIFMGLMIILHFVFPILIIFSFPFNLIGVALLLAGLTLSIKGSKKFERESTTVMTFDIPTILVTNGLYQYSRNPMYLGFLLMLLGFWILLGSLSNLILVIAFFLITNNYYIKFEEKVLHQKFGAAYSEYRKRVRKWI